MSRQGRPWLFIAAPFVLLAVLVMLSIPFEGPIALSIHFARIAFTVAGLIIFMRTMRSLIKRSKWERTDFFILSINFFLLSLVCFSFWNEAGRIFHVDTSVFTSPVAGAFSIMAIIASVSAIIALDTEGPWPKIIALAVGAVLSVGLVFVAPLFR